MTVDGSCWFCLDMLNCNYTSHFWSDCWAKAMLAAAATCCHIKVNRTNFLSYLLKLTPCSSRTTWSRSLKKKIRLLWHHLQPVVRVAKMHSSLFRCTNQGHQRCLTAYQCVSMQCLMYTHSFSLVDLGDRFGLLDWSCRSSQSYLQHL